MSPRPWRRDQEGHWEGGTTVINPCRAIDSEGTEQAQLRSSTLHLSPPSSPNPLPPPRPAGVPASLQPVESNHSLGARGTELVSVCEIGLTQWGSPERNVRRAFSRAGWEANGSRARAGGRQEGAGAEPPSPRSPLRAPRPARSLPLRRRAGDWQLSQL